jgi:predicted nucleotidyltransferase
LRRNARLSYESRLREDRAVRRDEARRLLRRTPTPAGVIAATSFYLFGATARDEAGEASDRDLFVHSEKDGDLSAIGRVV